jgi:hypothetical protein
MLGAEAVFGVWGNSGETSGKHTWTAGWIGAGRKQAKKDEELSLTLHTQSMLDSPYLVLRRLVRSLSVLEVWAVEVWLSQCRLAGEERGTAPTTANELLVSNVQCGFVLVILWDSFCWPWFGLVFI